MSEKDERDTAEAAGDGEAAVDGKKASGRSLFMIIGAGVVLLVVVAVPGAWMLGFFGGESSTSDVRAEKVDVKPSIFFSLPEITVNFLSQGQKTQYLRARIVLELSDNDVLSRVQKLQPRIEDMFTVYLSELRIEDLSGSAGIYMLKEELRKRVDLILQSDGVEDILFKQLLIQ